MNIWRLSGRKDFPGYSKFTVVNVTAVKIEGGCGESTAAFIHPGIFYDLRSRFRIASGLRS